MIPKRTYLFHVFRCAAAQFGLETNHPEFVDLGTMVTSTQRMWLDVADRGESSAHVRRCTHEVGLI
jgi:hypothetical protein